MQAWRHSKLLSTVDVRVAPDNILQESARSDMSSLVVREFIQNALDNTREESEGANSPVVVNIYFTNEKDSVNEYFGDLKEHMAMPLYRKNRRKGEDAEDRQWKDLHVRIYKYLNREKKIVKKRKKYRKEPSRFLDPIKDMFDLSQRCMVLEDYNTTGLTGEISDNPNAGEDDITDKFEMFVYNDGVTGSKESFGGSHGSGRKSVLYASCIQSILVYTKRANEIPHEVVSGISFTQARQNNSGKKYKSDSRFVHFDPEDEQKIIEGHKDPEIIKDVKEKFGLRRVEEKIKDIATTKEKGDAGLSVIIPFPDDGLNDKNIKIDILVNYALSIYSGKLVVVQQSRKGDKELLRYHKGNIKEMMKKTIDKTSSSRGSEAKKIRIIKCLYELLDKAEQDRVVSSKPDIVLNLEENFTDRVRDAFRDKVEKEDRLEEMKEKYDNFEVIHIHVKKKFVYDLEDKEDEIGHYKLFLKKVEGEGYSLLMRGFTIHLGEERNKKRDKYVSLTIAHPEEKGEANPYAAFLRECETADHRKIRESRAKSTDVKSYRDYLRGFKKAHEICEYLDKINRRSKGDITYDKTFILPKQEVNGRNRSKDGFIISSEGNMFTIVASDHLKEEGIGNGEEVEVYAYYGKEVASGNMSQLKQKFFPKFQINLDTEAEDKIEYLGERGQAKVIQINSLNFRIRGIIVAEEDLYAGYYVRCILQRGSR